MYNRRRHSPFSYRTKEIYEGGIYHITQRATGKEGLFLEERDYLSFLQMLKKRTEDFNLDIFCFCLMPNHLHILLRINKPNLTKAMKSLFTAYAIRFNNKYKRKGHVFSGVYRASPCMDEAHLIAASLYIHLNPQKAGIIKDAADYRWSSIGPYINFQIQSFVNRDFILKIINENLREASSLYKIMLKENADSYYHDDIEKQPRAIIEFAKANLGNITSLIKDKNIKSNYILSEQRIDSIISEFRNRDKIRIGDDRQRRKIFTVVKHLKTQGFTLTDISNKLSVSRKALYQILAKGNK